MPELPEVEVVRRGLADHVLGRRVREVEVFHPRSVRRQPGGGPELVERLTGQVLRDVRRRGKYLWVELGEDAPEAALLAHLGMSGQLLVQPAERPDEKHLRIRLRFVDDGPELRFVDQRTFGGLTVVDVAGPEALPVPVAHIGRDPLDPAFDGEAAVAGLRRRRTGLKRALLDQTLVSGIGNIYADEALWRAKLHYERPTATLSRPEGRRVLAAATEVMGEALAAGGTSFDALYVDVHGESGYFDRTLAVYGQEDRPCPRCGTPVRRAPFMNRSSYWCPHCQPRPRRRHP
ncbi:bifunctional DNA-formamidopyrimidine glycosylase/DNA-(apurinic or apyrimidinic site) lyase [Actinomycetospora lemnae]|uniref:Formamidopyrimidine-DNA glycosylase n=1 Tax=Actinomycetospora lemnae TaxID=3019891 RepID=A0ABT5SNG0_9PSEU|nr:bifunctional DNA-formamidopyrimidine glycosylase/DNA-(apurinic or apyrimidinic site) lyase [Actinomycetospora sp. DW7H6]MDD7964378.1 bifunctional DNA-formamidopyrimidine glycosylase/DNA-(apurinic or apyrimidinic site) lyase [Actinomycetospora sp. DW7H6]